MKRFFPTAIVVAIFFLGCDLLGGDSETPDSPREWSSEGISAEILESIPKEFLATVELDLYVDLFRGDTPPDITGAYHFDPVFLSRTTIPDDFTPGTQWPSSYLRFMAQDMDTNTVNYEQLESNPDGPDGRQAGENAYVIGEDDRFSVIARENVEIDGEFGATVLFVFSGRIAAEGIVDLRTAVVMIENTDPHDDFPAGTGRSFETKTDGYAVRTDWPESTTTAVLFLDASVDTQKARQVTTLAVLR